jgi:hypothetical protein
MRGGAAIKSESAKILKKIRKKIRKKQAKERENFLRARFQRVKQLVGKDYRRHALSDAEGSELVRSILEVKRMLPSLRLTTTNAGQLLRREIYNFLDSPIGKHYAAGATWHELLPFKLLQRRQRKLGKRPSSSSLYGKTGHFAMFHAKPINTDSRRALGWRR